MEGFSLGAGLPLDAPGGGFSLEVSLAATKPEPDITAPMPAAKDAPAPGPVTRTEEEEALDRARLKEAFYRAKRNDEARLETVMAVDFYVVAVFNTPDDAQRFAREAKVRLDDESCVDGYELARRFGLSHVPSVPMPWPKVQTPEKWRKLALDKLGEPPEFQVDWDGKGRMPPFPVLVGSEDLRVVQLCREDGTPLPPHLVPPPYPKEMFEERPKRKAKRKRRKDGN